MQPWLIAVLSAAAFAPLCAPAANAQAGMPDYPSRPITIVVPFGAGSGTDVITRFIAQPLGAALNQSIIIENKPGATGALAATAVARAPADGYTLLMATNSPSSAAPTLNKTIAYDPLKDFAPISRVGSFTFTLSVARDLQASSVAELIALAKASPGKLSYASGNTSGIVAGATLKHWSGIDILHVPYKTVPQAMNDVLAGRVPIIFADLSPALPHIRAGTIRALAVTRMQRSTLLPDVSTMHEAGVTGFEMDSWAGMIAPANTLPAIIERLNAELRKIIDDPGSKARMSTLGFEAFSSTPDELADFMRVQLITWTKMIRDAGIEPD
jgi:tripartite-type tricarboxylate transporter receptor subunit TctC